MNTIFEAKEKMELSPEQLEKLRKLDDELERKRKFDELNETRRQQSSLKTGIPIDLVDSDVVKVATLFGLVKSLDVLEGRKERESSFSLLNFFLDNESEKLDYSNIPSYFVFSSNRISEAERFSSQKSFVEKTCASFCSFINAVIEEELTNVSSVIYIPPQTFTMETFVDTISSSLNDILEMMEDEDGPEVWAQLSRVRNSLVKMIPICDYKRVVVSHVKRLETRSARNILNHLSFVDANLSLFPGFQTIPFQDSSEAILTSLIVRNHTKDPELKAFDLDTIVKECCVPALMFVDVFAVCRYGIIGPYRNDPICFANFTNQSFYVLKRIQNGIRVWILDEALTTFSEKLRNILLEYCVKIFKTFCGEFFGGKLSREAIETSEIASKLLENVQFLCQPARFRNEMRNVVKASILLPTELDVFNEIPQNDNCIELAEKTKLPQFF